MDYTKFTIAGIGLAALVPFWQQTKSFIAKIFRIFVKQRIIPYEFSNLFYKTLFDKSFVINFNDYDLHTAMAFSVLYKRWFTMVFKLYKLEIFLYKGFIPIFLSGRENKLKIQYIQFTFDFDKFFNYILSNHYKLDIEQQKEFYNNRFYIYEKRGKSLKTIQVEKLKQDFDSLDRAANNSQPSDKNNNQFTYTIDPNGILRYSLDRMLYFQTNKVNWQGHTDEIKNKYIFTQKGTYILGQVKKWLKAETWYQERNIVWRRSILLNGRPGNGKSTLILEIAKTLGIPIFVYHLNTFDNEEFGHSINDLTNESAIVLFEDIDCQWKGREIANKSTQFEGLTFDYFINKLSGVKSIKNKFIFITTNHLDKLDDALIRSGRVDEIIDLPSLDKEEKIQMANIVLDNNKELVDRIVLESGNDTTADFENRVVREALNKYWN